MLDIQTTDAAIPATDPATIRREDYRPPDWFIPEIELDFQLGLERTVVRSKLDVRRSKSAKYDAPLILNGDDLLPVNVLVDGKKWNEWKLEEGNLTLPLTGAAHIVEIEVELDPSTNTQLMGLYGSNGMLCTQCEAEGFRRITFFADRPDVLSRYKVRMEGDKQAFPILLCNGDKVEEGEAEGGRHWAQWNDPWPKPSYLFALVAGDLVANSDSFTTRSGKEVELNIWVRDGDLPRTGHAMQALKDSMRWDEEVYGREYDLGLFNIVAVSDFNMGAMENKGLNVFNSRYILADPEVATDADFDGIEGVVAHEYFHNWSGNRVTCRDWFQLSLKEGFTVFRDQSFSADMSSAALKRIEDVRILRAAQFPEDAGPLAHPIRPESYQEISNFYTATVYNKGAEIIRMMHSMMGAENFRKGTDLYFDRHDGEAATCEDFVVSMEDGGGIDLTQFRVWYRTPGTPRVSAKLSHNPQTGTATLELKQSIAAGGAKPGPSEMVIPLRTALLNPETGEHDGEQLLILDKAEQSFTFEGQNDHPVLSINRGFSAPIILENSRTAEELAFLSSHDDDPFARFEAMQQLMTGYLTAQITGTPADRDIILQAIGAVLADENIDRAFLAEIILLPTEAFLGDQMVEVDPQAIHDAREKLRGKIGVQFERKFRRLYKQCVPGEFSLSAEARADRKLRNVTLGYIAASQVEDAAEIAYDQYCDANNMTAMQGALGVLSHLDAEERGHAFESFYTRFKDNALVLDKWFTMQAMSQRSDTIKRVDALSRHPDFTLANPNRVRALYGAFAGNQVRFHDPSGRGYAMIADMVIALDPQNPQTAARFIPQLGRWRRYERGRSELMRLALEKIAATSNLSKDVAEQVSKSLA
ncbi:aminopeptidase N [Parasphingorhabdus halotolerans]|uniref:Aminopeptidase N n=1 Tax=Parasphingorhabdus halotolerans TaxID=2725558 RepID=A0A6H2DM57_9SPHN|nr:aminopeptidase N [Parasphingorhabdus halotolerans]QJB68746.1 aminopeptidase N [Parasphingorhabdus halotolerans]